MFVIVVNNVPLFFATGVRLLEMEEGALKNLFNRFKTIPVASEIRGRG